MTAPKRICLLPDDGWSWVKGPKPPYEENAIEYVRADMHDATKAKLEKAVEALRWQADQPEAHPFMVLNARAVLAEIEKGGV